jgi:hypothetical protein
MKTAANASLGNFCVMYDYKISLVNDFSDRDVTFECYVQAEAGVNADGSTIENWVIIHQGNQTKHATLYDGSGIHPNFTPGLNTWKWGEVMVGSEGKYDLEFTGILGTNSCAGLRYVFKVV